MISARLKEIEAWMRRFPDLPPAVFFKEDLIRLGLSLGLRGSPESSYQKKSYFIFSFDRTPIEQMSGQENLRAPEEIALLGGPYGLRRTIVSVRLNPSSPYRLERNPTRDQTGSPAGAAPDGVSREGAVKHGTGNREQGTESEPRPEGSGSGGYVLTLGGETICQVQFPPEPEYYRRKLRNGKAVSEIAPTIEWGYL